VEALVKRTAAQVREHYEIEKRLAARLAAAPKRERASLYKALYDELFRRVPHHPQLVLRESLAARRATAERQVRFLASLARSVGADARAGAVFVEVGAGDCLISLAFADRAARVYAVDVSNEITGRVTPPANFELVLSDGCSIPVPPASADLVFSNQLMEHLHPDDAVEQLRNIFAALKPGGAYFCITPNRMSGPHDVSQYFDRQARGFHLREYRIGELIGVCREAGFTRFRVYIGKDGRYLRVPVALVALAERFAALLPARTGKLAPLRLVLGIRLLAIKGLEG
jgi:SAM-dependent methyltransferase